MPLYQRPYVWKQDSHWEPLWQDILVVLEHYLENEGDHVTHFLGAIVLDQEDNAPGEAVRRLVIDGQQPYDAAAAARGRSALRRGRWRERQARLLTKLVRNDADITSGDERFKVWPTNANQAAFRAVMQDDGPDPAAPDDPANTVHEGYAYFRQAIQEWMHGSSSRSSSSTTGSPSTAQGLLGAGLVALRQARHPAAPAGSYHDRLDAAF